MTTTSNTAADKLLAAAQEMAEAAQETANTIRTIQEMNTSLSRLAASLDREVTELRDMVGRGPLGKKSPAYKEFISKAYYKEFVNEA